MDRSFLSQPEVIDASRDFVCVRLATYESKKEAKFLKSVFTGGSGELENTVFCILSPDGRRKLVRAGRSPNSTFRGPPRIAAEEMADTMNRIAAKYHAKRTSGSKTLEVPTLADCRLALNVAACDNQPLVVMLATDKKELQTLAKRLAPITWSDEFIGRLQYVSVTDPKELKPIEGVEITSGYLVVEPGEFGLDGTVVAQIPQSSTAETIKDALDLSLALHERMEKDTFSHLEAGKRLGVEWRTAIPVTDPHSPGKSGRRRGPRRRGSANKKKKSD